MKKFVRESKFRHVFGQASPKDQQFEGIVASSSRLDGNIIAVNRKFIAVVLNTSGGGIFTVLSRGRPGRYEKVSRFIGHSSEVIDLCFDNFNANRIISGSEDGTFIVWIIQGDGPDDDVNEYQCLLKGSQRRAVQAVWHTSSEDVVFCVNVDAINIFNVGTAECIRTIDTSKYSDQIFNVCLNYDSTQIAVSSKDKKIRVFKNSDGSLVKDFQAHEGSKPSRVAWLTGVGSGNFLVTTGATKMSERQVCVWDLNDPSSPVSSENLDNSSGVLYIHYDPDTSLVALYSKGEVTVRIFECEPTGQLYLTVNHQSQEPQRAAAFGNKLSCNFMANEIMHFVRVLSKSIEEVAFIVPRRSDLFQDDLFPDCVSDVPAMTAADFVAGKVAPPNLVSLKTYQPLDNPNVFVLTRAAASPVGRSTSSVGVTGSTRPSSSGISTLSDLQDTISEMRKELVTLREQVRTLEQRIH